MGSSTRGRDGNEEGGGKLGVCSATGMSVNETASYHIQQVVHRRGATPTCGRGWYENETRGWVTRDVVHTASEFSGMHCLPINICAPVVK